MGTEGGWMLQLGGCVCNAEEKSLMHKQVQWEVRWREWNRLNIYLGGGINRTCKKK